MRELFALTILGLEKTEYTVATIFLDAKYANRKGEIPGRNFRYLLDITKDKLFQILESLLQKNILKYSTTINENVIYIQGGKCYYVFNSNYNEWIPTENSLFYKLCKLKGLRFNTRSYNKIISELDFREAIKSENKEVDKGITPYEVYDLFCKLYKQYFGKEYVPLNQYRDFSTTKKIICKCSFKGISDSQIKSFIDWCFKVKAKTFSGNFIIGFLPLCLSDYLKANVVEQIDARFKKDENGHLRERE